MKSVLIEKKVVCSAIKLRPKVEVHGPQYFTVTLEDSDSNFKIENFKIEFNLNLENYIGESHTIILGKKYIIQVVEDEQSSTTIERETIEWE